MILEGAIRLRLLPERGLDVREAWLGRTQLAWLKEPDGEGWRGAWPGGLATTCGLDNVGAPSEGVGLHGTYAFQPARDVRVDGGRATAVVEDPRGLRVERTVATSADEPLVELADLTTNVAAGPLEAPVLYHVNLGAPLWAEASRIETDADRVEPRDADAAAAPWDGPPRSGGGPERVYEHAGATEARVEAAGIALTLRFDLPRLWQWVDPTLGALGLEPANCSVLGRAHDRAEGRLPFLAPGESRSTRIAIAVEAR